MSSRPLRVTSLQADSALPFYAAVAAHLGDELGTGAEMVSAAPWPERARLLDAGAVDLAFVCGWNYTARVDAGRDHLALLAAPVPAAERYRDRPVYFSDVIVRADAAARSFADLRGRRWAYNEPRSHSGYNLTLYHLSTLGETGAYFARCVEAGSHQRAIELVLAGEVDAAAIDSYVLELERARRPELGERLRVVATLGPSPSPPVVVRRALPGALQGELRRLLTTLHESEPGRRLLASGALARYAPVGDADYDPIRRMAEARAGLTL